MQRLGHADYATLLEFAAELHQPTTHGEFGPRLVNLTSRLFPGTTIAFDQIDEHANLYQGFDHNMELSSGEQLRVHRRLQDLYQQNPIYHYVQSGGCGPVVDLDDLMPKRDFRMTDFYQDIFRPYRLKHQVTLLLSREGWICTLTLNQEKPISQRQKLMLSVSAKHIQLAHQNVCERTDRVMKCPDGVPNLTTRECEIFHWLGQGKRNREIAIILGCAPRTVDKHVENILRKAGAETRTAAAAMGVIQSRVAPRFD